MTTAPTPEPVDFRTVPPPITPVARGWQAWWEDHNMWDGFVLYADLDTAKQHAAVDYIGEEYGWVPGDDPADEAPDRTLTWVFERTRWYLLDNGKGTDVQLYETATYASVASATERRDRYAQVLADADGWKWADGFKEQSPAWQGYQQRADAVMTLVGTEQAELRRERDLAIAHDRQPYPTAWAYEQACAALHRKTEAIERVLKFAASLDETGRTLAGSEAVHPVAAHIRHLLDPQPVVVEKQQPQCDVEFEGGGRCAKTAGHRPPGSQDPHVPVVEEQPEASPFTVQVWPLARILTEVRCGSQDWTWDEEWADLDRRHAETGYLAKLEQDIRTNGITMPVLIGTDGRLWDGHHRLRIAVRLGLGYVPVELPAVGEQPDTGTPEAEAPVAYSGKGRVWCITCPLPADEDVPLTIEAIDPWECCAGCGRYVVDVARAAVAQPGKET
ncbi:ParB N-terminal domain-containing protein [Streptomyces phaeochromogenes]|uniref:ParB N-terminal domain-containing protein n=1 Tax=Streptomyces phaeochromogenes TaxID=1923 RepID=UPI00367E0D07